MAQRIGILTGGGDCPGLNPAIRGCVVRALGLGYECVGLRDGWKGLVQGNAVPLGLKEVEDLMSKGGTVLGTSRTNPYKKEGAVDACLENFKKLDLHALVAMGGEDTLGVAAQLYKSKGVNVVGVPKTMDNDLSATDFTFGFDSASSVAMDAAERLKDTGRSHHRAMVLEVMGRHAGWVALYTALAAGADAVCLPERKTDLKTLAEKVKKAHARKGYALIVTSEAADVFQQKGEEKLDEFGHMILKERGVGETLAKSIEKETGLETRHAVIGHVQRGGPPTLFDRILALRVGAKAADLVQKKRFGQMTALRGNEVVSAPLEEAVAKLKTVSEDWLQFADALMP